MTADPRSPGDTLARVAELESLVERLMFALTEEPELRINYAQLFKDHRALATLRHGDAK